MKQCLTSFRLILSLFLLCNGILSFAQQKWALLVGISDYSKEYHWTHINSTNDVNIIRPLLKGFNVVELQDSKATYTDITKNLELLSKRTKAGDIVYIHFSGHGQPFEDTNGDEKDGWDESFVPYDAGCRYGENGYIGNKHLIDDELNRYITKIRRKLGSKGFLYVVIDACHSGTMNRGDDENLDTFDPAPIRGTNVGFSKTKFYRPKRESQVNDHYSIAPSKDMANIIILEACAANQKNQEIKVSDKYYGALSYALYTTIKKQGFKPNLKWSAAVQSTTKKLLKARMANQTMIIETSLK